MYAQFNRMPWKAILLAIAISLLALTVALAASGDLDTTFDGDGRATTDIGGGHSDQIMGIAIQPNGKIVVVGTARDNLVVARYNTNGSLDATFSADGKLTTNFGGIDNAEDVAIQSNGKILVTGTRCLNEGWPNGNCDLAVARYLSNGTLDSTFSGDGKLTTAFGSGANGTWSGVAIQPNGKIVVAGYMRNGANFDFAVYRYNANGILDATFSGDGRASVGFASGPEDLATDLVLQPDGKIVVGGVSCDSVEPPPWQNCDFAAIRLNANGSLDNTFSGDGRQVINFGGLDLSDGISLQADGKIVLAGYKETPTESYFAVARLNTNGTLDTSFRGTGKATTGFGVGSNAHGRDIRVQSDGKILVVGSARGNFALARYEINGTLDTAFSADGKAMVNFGFDDVGWVLALQPSDGKYVLGGWTDNGTQMDLALARLLP